MPGKVKIDNIHLAVDQDGRVHAGIFAGGSKKKMITHKDIHGDFLSCVITRFFGKPPEMFKADDGTMYMIMVTKMKKATDEEKKLILGEDKELILPNSMNGLKKT